MQVFTSMAALANVTCAVQLSFVKRSFCQHLRVQHDPPLNREGMALWTEEKVLCSQHGCWDGIIARP